MRHELHRYLDGELSFEELPEALRAEARAWDAWLEEVRAAGPAGAPPGLTERVMGAVREETSDSEPAWRRFLEWWVRPRPVPVPPLAAALAAGLVAFLLLGPLASERAADTAAGERAAATTVEGPPGGVRPVGRGGERVYVQFLLPAPGASSVALAGDFNGWTPSVRLTDEDGDGIWSARVPLRPGVHEYMYVVDGSRWVTDPYAERYSEDGFGNRNAVLAIATPGT